MRIVLATPLYPPEIADAASYTKELARRLSENGYTITVVAYTHLPEPLPGVTVVEVDKRQSRLVRVRAFQKALARAAREADAVIAINGASVELPLLFTSLPKTILCIADQAAYQRPGLIKWVTLLRFFTTVKNVPDPKPEILPLEPEPTEALAAWEAAWQTHLATLDSLLKKHA